MPGGRPTKYKPEYCAQADEYIKHCQDKERKGKKLLVNLPMIEEFALELDVNESTMYEWAKKYPEFSKALKKIKQAQQKRLVSKGLSGEYNPLIAKLVLSANHGMTERSDHTSKGEKIEQVPIYGSKSTEGDI